VDLFSAVVIVGAGVLFFVGRVYVRRWQDRHWDERRKAADTAQSEVLADIRKARSAGRMLGKFPNVGADWQKRRRGPNDLAP
jgi:hypothetical protein